MTTKKFLTLGSKRKRSQNKSLNKIQVNVFPLIPEWDGKRGLYDIMKGKVEERGGRGREGGGTFSSAPNFPDRVFSLVVCFGRIISKTYVEELTK